MCCTENNRISLLNQMRNSSQFDGLNPTVNPVYSMEYHPTLPNILCVSDEVGAVGIINTRDNATYKFTACKCCHSVNRIFLFSIPKLGIPILLWLTKCSFFCFLLLDNKCHTNALGKVTWSSHQPYIIATGSSDQTVSVWDINKNFLRLASYNGHEKSVRTVKYHPTRQRKLILV